MQTSAQSNSPEMYDAGRPPGLLTAPDGAAPTQLSLIRYGPQDVLERTPRTDEVAGLRSADGMIWLNVNGLADIDVVRTIGEEFDLHKLALEDALKLNQRPKCEDYGSVLFLVARMLDRSDGLHSEQVAIFVGDGFVVTLQERAGDCFDPVRRRLREGRGRLRHARSDYLAYALLDAVIDGYFPVVEAYGDILEHIEEDIQHRSDENLMKQLHTVRRDLRRIRRAIWPQAEAIGRLLSEPHPLIEAETVPYLRDSNDHALRMRDQVQNYQEWSSDLSALYMSAVSNRMNEVMRVLTVVTSLFIPLTFVAGIYGMNFDPDVSGANMPELRWRFGYLAAVGLMLVMAAGQLWYFKRRGWLGGHH